MMIGTSSNSNMNTMKEATKNNMDVGKTKTTPISIIKQSKNQHQHQHHNNNQHKRNSNSNSSSSISSRNINTGSGNSSCNQKQQSSTSTKRMPHLSLNTAAVSSTRDNNDVIDGGGIGGGIISENTLGTPQSPFQREVREWQHIDPDTGALHSGRLEADRWTNGPLNSYGKVSNSQNVLDPNGIQHTQRKQFEVLQACTANGAMQVIRTQNVQTTSSRWSSSTTTTASSATSSSSSSPSPMALINSGGSGRGSSPPTINTTGISNGFGAGRRLFDHHHHIHNHNHSPIFKHKPFLAQTQTANHLPSTRSNKVDICEVSDNDVDVETTFFDNIYDVDDSNVVSNRTDHAKNDNNHHQHRYFTHYTINGGVGGGGGSSVSSTNSSTSTLNSIGSNSSNKPISLVGRCRKNSSNTTNNNNNNNIDISNFLLLDTAPSLKLSNLMKSSSSISSNNSSSNNSTNSSSATATATAAARKLLNTHKSADGKISLHTIVGNKPATTSTISWRRLQQQQQQQQPALYGQNGNSKNTSNLIKSHVGVNITDMGTCGSGAATDDDEPRHRHYKNDELTATRSTMNTTTPPPTQSNRELLRQRDLESFRHYRNIGSNALSDADDAHKSNNDDDDDDDDDDNDILRLTSRLSQRRRRQKPPTNQQSSLLFSRITPLQRSHSISNDDLSPEWDKQAHDGISGGIEDANEWRRVSKLRRSFQSTLSGDTFSNNRSDKPITTTKRPLDLPINSVSVSRIRAELENGRRLNTAMRNNHLDLTALQTILNSPSSNVKTTPSTTSTTFLTAESLKEIRAKLKKLSDESLYKDDFMAHQKLPSADEHIEVEHEKNLSESANSRREAQDNSAYRYMSYVKKSNSPVNTVNETKIAQRTTSPAVKHTTNSWESRQKYNRDTTQASDEWHNRRKSYGFEKMSPPADKSMTIFRMDASTDSGLGRSGELENWSPTDTSSARATVVHFGEPAKIVANPIIEKRSHNNPTTTNHHKQPTDNHAKEDADDDRLKRHSIAVDESQYVRKTSQVRLNCLSDSTAVLEPSKSLDRNEFENSIQHSNSSTSLLLQKGQQKRVEFCKTEVHFAAESGRVNIVETDGKPPPTNNFRRRRRTASGPLQSLVKSASSGNVALPITRFGDDPRQHKMIASTTVAYKASLVDATESSGELAAKNVTVSLTKPATVEPLPTNAILDNWHNSYASTTCVDTTDNETDELSAIRGILKNKPVKPKPYHLGENLNKPQTLWGGIQLKSITNSTMTPTTTNDTATTKSLIDNSHSNGLKSESPINIALMNKSVAERVRIVEKRHEPYTNAYSTKINLNLGDLDSRDWIETGVQSQSHNGERRPSAQNRMLSDLREHQRILDEGLKSTSLIIKTMRSANEFDEAMRRLSIASMDAAATPAIVVPTPMLRSNSYQEAPAIRSFFNINIDGNSFEITKSASCSSTSTMAQRLSNASTLSNSLIVQQMAAPQLNNTTNAQVSSVSQQLTQLRRMNETSDSHGDDSADEEVKSYFREHIDNYVDDDDDSGGTGGEGTQDCYPSSMEDERTVKIDHSKSWKHRPQKKKECGIKALEQPTLDRTELPKSNVMSIELHSPQTSASIEEKIREFKSTTPIARPRTISMQPTKLHHHTTTTTTTEPTKEPLKIVKEARGARRLRNHELSYFGVAHDANEAKTKIPSDQQRKSTSNLINKQSPIGDWTTTRNESQQQQQQITKWQLLNDKPDLLRHSPNVEPAKRLSLQKSQARKQRHINLLKSIIDGEAELGDDYNDDDNDEDHLYENISTELKPVFKVKAPVAVSTHRYDRKTDLKRDVMILNEMTHNADQTLKALSDEAVLKGQRRRSVRRCSNNKPLETIDEKTNNDKINNRRATVKVNRSTLASEAKRTSCNHTSGGRNLPHTNTTIRRIRTSSQSSVESGSNASRSRSLSSEREYDSLRRGKIARDNLAAIKSSLQPQPKSTLDSSRSNSRESQRSSQAQYSSSEDIAAHGHQERIRSKHRIPSHGIQSTADKHSEKKRSTIPIPTTPPPQATDDKRHRPTCVEIHPRASSTMHSSQRERIQCQLEANKSTQAHYSQQRSSDRSSSSSKRRHRTAQHDSHSSHTRSSPVVNAAASQRNTSEKIGHHRSTTTHRQRSGSTGSAAGRTMLRSANKSERPEKEKDKKISRSRGRTSSRSTNSHNNSDRVNPECQVHGSGSTGASTKLRERSKKVLASTTSPPPPTTTTTTTSSTSATKQHHTDNDPQVTHSKIGHHYQQHLRHHQDNQMPQVQHHPQTIHHQLKSTTIAAKHHHREHSNGKDRK